MINTRGIRYLIPLTVFLSCFLPGMGQPTLSADDLRKPKKYENRQLRAEKTGEKKFTAPRRFFQNTYTHYNYFFNAQNKLNQVLESAKASHTDQYSELLSFYNYTLENTSSQKTELDSVIYKVNAGIYLHDLRSNWMDNLYLLMGQAYYYRNTLDTAFMSFQYMNYAFSPKEEDGFDKVIASNANEGGNVLKVSTVENRNIIDKAFSKPPSRNDALVWLVRTHISRNDMGEAATLIQTLRNDPTFPERLAPQLAEVTAWWFYQRSQYDSAAFYLEKALPAAASKQESARWEYLLGQLYDRAGLTDKARDAFQRCIRHTLDPVMEVAAQLQAAQQFTGTEDMNWQTVIANLEKMARREKYHNYRDLIYYTIGKIEVKQNLLPEARGHLLKSVKYSRPNTSQKAMSYLMLADVSFDRRDYQPAKQYYDSIDANLLPDTLKAPVAKKMVILEIITAQYAIIKRQDSLQLLAAMPEEERTTLLKKTLRQLRKQKGLTEEETAGRPAAPGFQAGANAAPTDLFSSQNAGEWYFYNNALKSRGFNEFRNKWGNRPNADNWRLSSGTANQPLKKEVAAAAEKQEEISDTDPSLEKLVAGIPLTEEAIKMSNDSIREANFLLAYTLQNELEDYAGAAGHYEKLLERFPGSNLEAEVLYNLAICYRMMGKTDELTATNKRLTTGYPGSRLAMLATDPKAVKLADSADARQATETYDRIYDQFISGRFDEALAAKKQADSTYGNHFWTPQLLYIEAVYHVKQRNDSLGISTLEQIIGQFPEHGLAEKAKNLLSVLQRRSEIEAYLTQLQVERPLEDSTIVPAPQTDLPPIVVAADTVKTVIAAHPQPLAETKKPVADSSRLKKEAPKAPAASLFNRHADQPHFVVVVLDNVDPVYVNETKNAFTRYNKEKYYNEPMNVLIVSLTESVKMVSIRGLANELAAIEYIKKARELAPREIIPWLKSDKYYFLPVAEDNMNLLMDSKNLPAYRDFLKQLFPDQF